jgi:hypothetical protein
MYYSNSGYFILGWVIEKITGMTYDDYFKVHIFNKLGMASTWHLGDTVMPVKTGAQPYQIISSQRYVSQNGTIGPKASPAGGWLSTANDLYLFMRALHHAQLMSPKTLSIMQTANHTQRKDSAYRFYAYGLETYLNQPIPRIMLYGHNGGGGGFSIDVYAAAKTDYIIVSCTNLYQNSRPIAMNYFRMAMGKGVQPVSRSFAVKLYDLIDSVSIDHFIANEKEYFKKLNLQPHPGVFAQLSDAMGRAGDYATWIKWMGLAKSYYPEEGYLWILSGDSQVKSGNLTEAKKMYETAKDVGIKHNDKRVIHAAEEKLKTLL